MKKLITALSLTLFLCWPGQQILAQKYIVEKLPPSINTPDYDEIAPIASVDGSQLYFTRVGYPDFNKTLIEQGEDLSYKMSNKEYMEYLRTIYSSIARKRISDPVSSGFNQDIWLATGHEGDFDAVIHPGYPLNNAMPNSVSSLTPSGNELIVLNQFEAEGGMKKGFSIIRKTADNSWTFPQPVGIENYYNSGSDVSMNMSQDGSVLILAMERGDSYGQSDLYICHRTGPNTWSEPQNMGHQVNSKRQETTPYLSADNTRLFFSSNRHGTKGGNDIFMLIRKGDSWTDWSRPRRFKAPINSKYDDSQPFFNSVTGYLYLTSKREGSSDIYRVRIAPPVPIGVVVKGKIINGKTGKPIAAKVRSGLANNDLYKNVYVSEDGTFELTVPKGVQFSLIAERPGYMGVEDTLYYRSDYVYYKDKHVDLVINPVEPGTKIEMDPVYFAQSKPEILDKSFPALDKLANFLRENYFITIKISGHTDNQGEKASLFKLSEERAEAVKKYLVYKRYINPLRIETEGFGDSQPVTDNSTDDLRKLNRRVEIEIIRVHEPEMTIKDDDKN